MVVKYREKHFDHQGVPTPSSQVSLTLSSIEAYRQCLVEMTTKIDDLKALESSLVDREAKLKAQIASLQSELRQVEQQRKETIDARAAAETEMSNLCEEMQFQAEVFENTITDARNSIYTRTHLKARTEGVVEGHLGLS